MTGRTIRFLSIDDVARLHAIAIQDQGGDASLLDLGKLESALAQPRQQFGGEYLHPDIPAMAAAYAFHICQNHPFADGNKRAAFAALVAFLTDNGWKLDADQDEAANAVLALAAGRLDKPAFHRWTVENSHEKPRLELRSFFQRIDDNVLLEMLRSWNAAPTVAEFDQSILDARVGIPLIRDLEFQLATHSGRAVEIGSQIMILVAIYRIAEDMGYEW